MSCCSRRSALTARRNTEYHQCSLARPARSGGHVLSIRASQIIFPVVQLRAGALRSPFPSPPFAHFLFLPIANLFGVKRFREDVLATSLDINSHLARARREVSAVHFKRRIGDVKIELDRLDRFDSGATTHCFGVTLNHFVNRGWRAATSKRRRCEYGCPDQFHQAALPIHDY